MYQIRDNKGEKVWVRPGLVAVVEWDSEDGETTLTMSCGKQVTFTDEEGRKATDIIAWVNTL